MTSLEEQLTLSAPPVPAHNDELHRELLLINDRAEAMASSSRSRPRRRRLTLGALAAIGVVGAGVGAAGAAGILPWFDTAPVHGVMTTSTGEKCEITLGVKPIEDPSRPVTPATRAAAVAAAESFLRDLDVSSINVAEATRGLPPRATVDSESGPAQSVAEYETDAVSHVVQERVDDALRQQGLPVSATSISVLTSCDGGQK